MEKTNVVVRFCGDSGDGMQLTGNMFSSLSAILGNEISTLPDFPAEIRAPQGTLGGVLGKKHANYSNINNDVFHQVDTRSFNILVIDSKSPKLLTEKPESSYTLTKNDDGTSTLKIINTKEFWETSPYLIVMK